MDEIYGGEDVQFVLQDESNSTEYDQVIYADGSIVYMHNGSYYVPAETTKPVLLQDEVDNEDNNVMSCDIFQLVGASTIPEIIYELPCEEPAVDKEVQSQEKIIDMVVGKNLITGQAVTLHDYFDKYKRKDPPDFCPKVINSKFPLGVTCNGKKLYGKIVRIEKPVKCETEIESVSEIEVDVVPVQNDDEEANDDYIERIYLDAISKTLTSLIEMDSVRNHLIDKPLILKLYEKHEETVLIGKMYGCLQNLDGWTFINFDSSDNQLQLKYKLRFVSPTGLNFVLNRKNEEVKIRRVSLTPICKQHFCILCRKELTNLKALNRHYAIHHSNFELETQLPNLTCETCSRTFKSGSSLKRHRAVHNPALRNLECAVCAQRFTDNSSLKKHLLGHTGFKPNICDICKRGFAHVGDLNMHRKTHFALSSQVFTCLTCGRTFFRQSNMLRHMRIHDNGAHKCHVCGCTYQHSSSLTRHLVQAHVSIESG